MRKVRMNVSIASASWSYVPKQVVELEDEVAEAWIACGHASPLEPAPEEEQLEASEGGVDDDNEDSDETDSGSRANKSRRSKKSS